MIDEKKLIEFIEKRKMHMIPDPYGYHPVTVENVLNLLNKFPKINQWIPCSERLPECELGYETEAVLFQLESGSIEVGYYGTGGKFRDRYFRPYRDHMDGFDAKNVIAWMPLPEPYKET